MLGKLKHIAVLAMAFSILTGSVGMAATERFCAMFGVTLDGPAQAKMEKMGCCSKEEKPGCPVKLKMDKKKCCSISTTYEKLDVESSLKFSKVEFVSLPAVLANPFPLPLVARTTPTSDNWPFYSDTSPPLAGRDLLNHIQVLTI